MTALRRLLSLLAGLLIGAVAVVASVSDLGVGW